MARVFNGSSDSADSATLTLSSYSVLTLSFWAYNTQDSAEQVALRAGTGNVGVVNDLLFECRTDAAGKGLVALYKSGPTVWNDTYPQPSLNAWHHYLWVANRATPAHSLWIDGAATTLTLKTHTLSTYGNYSDAPLRLGKYTAGTPLWFAGRFAEVAIWGGVSLGLKEAVALAAGTTPPNKVRPDSLIFYAPLLGADSPEPDYSGTQRNLTLANTSAANHPRVQAGIGA